MKLKNFLDQLNKLVAENPKLGNFTVKFRGENQEEHITHHHVEGRTLYLSDVWAENKLNPLLGKPKEDSKMVEKLKAFLTDKECLAAEKKAKQESQC